MSVLNFARKNRYPRNRSALTYWEDNFPSRLDLGKEKYGGPFTEEGVENVKTFLMLIPLTFVSSLRGLAPYMDSQYHHMIMNRNKLFVQCFLNDEVVIATLIFVFGIPFFHETHLFQASTSNISFNVKINRIWNRATPKWMSGFIGY